MMKRHYKGQALRVHPDQASDKIVILRKVCELAGFFRRLHDLKLVPMSVFPVGTAITDIDCWLPNLVKGRLNLGKGLLQQMVSHGSDLDSHRVNVAKHRQFLDSSHSKLVGQASDDSRRQTLLM